MRRQNQTYNPEWDQDAPQKELDTLNRRPICQSPNFICDGYHHHFDFKSMREVCPNTNLGEVTYTKCRRCGAEREEGKLEICCM